jgi:curved DNA-binding protein
LTEQKDGFIDYYELMQISPNAEHETIQRVFRMLAARYHPDNPKTGDLDHFIRLKQAYEVLSDSAARKAYDLEYQLRDTAPIEVFELQDFAAGIDGEANRRMGILCLLYNRRRSNPDWPGLSILAFETMMSMPREHLMFTVWYLKDKAYVRQDERSDFVITADGCDYVEKNLPTHKILYKLLKAAETGNIRSAGTAQDIEEEANR